MRRGPTERGVGSRVAGKGYERAGGGRRSIWIIDSAHKFREWPDSLCHLASG
jgi:hypothetical protein